MKNYFLIIVFMYAFCVQAQDRSNDIGRITIHAYVPNNEELPNESRKLLETKLSQIISSNGIADNENYIRFILTAKVNVISKDIVAGPPQRISQKLDITLMLGDIEEDKVYSQQTISAIGIGQSLEKSYISAFKNINPKNASIATFIKEGKEKMLAYYQSHCEDLITEAKKQASLQNFEDALLLLTSIPDVCTDCFNKASTLVTSIFKDMIDARGADYLNQARSTWARNPNKEGALEATSLLQQIHVDASCQEQAASFLREITNKMNEIDRREWEHEMQVYQDNIKREKRLWAQQVKEHEDRVQTQRMYLKAARDVAITYAKNQPKVITRTINYNRIILW